MSPARAYSVVLVAVALLLGTLLQPGAAGAVAGQPTALSLGTDRATVTFGTAATLTGRLTDPSTGAAVADVPVSLESRDAAGAWAEVSTLTTDSDGVVSDALAPQATTTFRLRHGQPGTTETSTSPEVTVVVRTALAAAASRSVIRVGRAVRITGNVQPADTALRLQRLVAGRWQTVATAGPAVDGAFSFEATPTAPGWWRWRVRADDRPDRLGRTVRLGLVNAVRMHTYTVGTRGSVGADVDVFRATVAATYADRRGWLRAHHGFREVRSGGDFTVVLSQARRMRDFSWICSASYSCQIGRYVVINQDRWRRGSAFFPADLQTYRQMVINHETGHWLGRHHAFCSEPGALAPVMQQQSKGMHGCRPNPWPLPGEIRAVSAR
jgi:hypothetical protein